jgi:hypothetical protein
MASEKAEDEMSSGSGKRAVPRFDSHQLDGRMDGVWWRRCKDSWREGEREREEAED